MNLGLFVCIYLWLHAKFIIEEKKPFRYEFRHTCYFAALKGGFFLTHKCTYVYSYAYENMVCNSLVQCKCLISRKNSKKKVHKLFCEQIRHGKRLRNFYKFIIIEAQATLWLRPFLLCNILFMLFFYICMVVCFSMIICSGLSYSPQIFFLH